MKPTLRSRIVTASLAPLSIQLSLQSATHLRAANGTSSPVSDLTFPILSLSLSLSRHLSFSYRLSATGACVCARVCEIAQTRSTAEQPTQSNYLLSLTCGKNSQTVSLQ